MGADVVPTASATPMRLHARAFSTTSSPTFSWFIVHEAPASFEFDNAMHASEPPRVASAWRQWGAWCEALFEQLATEAPAELAEIVRQGVLPASRLTYAADLRCPFSSDSKSFLSFT